MLKNQVVQHIWHQCREKSACQLPNSKSSVLSRFFFSQSAKNSGPLAQLVEQWIFNPLVARSSRARPTIPIQAITPVYSSVII